MPRHLPSLHLLRVFEAAGRHESFKLAAEELHVTPSAVSHQIKALEEQLGFTLFHRGNRQLRLTDGGQAYLDVVAGAMGRLRDGTERVLRAHGSVTLRISLMPTLARHVVLPRLKSFQVRVPGVRLHIESSQDLADLRYEGVDLAVRYGRGDWPDLHVAKLTGLAITPVCSPAFADEHAVGGLESLARVPLIQMSFFPAAWRLWLRAAGAEVPESVEELWLDTYDGCLEAAEQGLGVTLALLPLERTLLEAGRLVQPFDRAVADPNALHLVCRPGDEDREEVAAFRDWLLEQLA